MTSDVETRFLRDRLRLQLPSVVIGDCLQRRSHVNLQSLRFHSPYEGRLRLGDRVQV